MPGRARDERSGREGRRSRSGHGRGGRGSWSGRENRSSPSRSWGTLCGAGREQARGQQQDGQEGMTSGSDVSRGRTTGYSWIGSLRLALLYVNLAQLRARARASMRAKTSADSGSAKRTATSNFQSGLSRAVTRTMWARTVAPLVSTVEIEREGNRVFALPTASGRQKRASPTRIVNECRVLQILFAR